MLLERDRNLIASRLQHQLSIDQSVEQLRFDYFGACFEGQSKHQYLFVILFFCNLFLLEKVLKTLAFQSFFVACGF